jgi:hypothetical protein
MLIKMAVVPGNRGMVEPISSGKAKAPSGLSARGRDKKAQHPALKLQSGWANHIELSRSTRLERISAI